MRQKRAAVPTNGFRFCALPLAFFYDVGAFIGFGLRILTRRLDACTPVPRVKALFRVANAAHIIGAPVRARAAGHLQLPATAAHFFWAR
jgi:hypothetical protein